MAHNTTLEALQVIDGNSVKIVVTGRDIIAVPTTESGLVPKFVMLTAVSSNVAAESPAAQVGDYVTASPSTGGQGNENFGIPIVVGSPPIIFNAHGLDTISIGWPSNQTNLPDSITLYCTALENF